MKSSPGSHRPTPVKRGSATLQEIARRARCSIPVVSAVVNQTRTSARVGAETRERIERISAELEYKPNYHAQTLRSGRSNVQAMLIHDHSFKTGFYIDLLAGIKTMARMLDNDLLIVSKGPDCDEVERGKQLLQNRQVDSLIVMGTPYAYRIPELAGINEPVVIAGGTPTPCPFPRLAVDPAAGIREAVEQLALLGHTTILWAGCLTDGVRAVPERRRVFDAAIAKLNLRSREFYMTADGASASSGPDKTIASFKNQFSSYLDQHQPPTALMAFNEQMGVGIYAALQEHGFRVPDDVSVVGYDGHYADLVYPSMAVVGMEMHELGRRASDLAFRMAGDRNLIQELAGHVEYVPSRFMPGNSIAPANKRKLKRKNKQ